MGSNETRVNDIQSYVSIAKQRWKILARAVTGNRTYDDLNRHVSVRRFQCFGLFDTAQINTKHSSDADWYRYTSQDYPRFSLDVRHLRDDGMIRPETLNGFNNTGNICIWPSEEVMTYYCLKNLESFRNKTVIELGGGMTCLAGISVAVSTEVGKMVLTDGNEDSLKNLNLMIEENAGSYRKTVVTSRLVRWGPEADVEDLIGSFDCVLCADCFFFDEGRVDLIDLVHKLLRKGGQAIMFAPHRGSTLQTFVNLAKSKFDVTVCDNYDEKIYSMHQKLRGQGGDQFDENIHYPVQVLLRKDRD